MRPDVVIRPMTRDDAEPARAAAWEALHVMFPPEHLPDVTAEAFVANQLVRFHHLLETDPGGAWVAEAGGQVVGVALAIMREGIWGLSLFAIAPDHQGQGIGTPLLDPALRYGDASRGGIILSSTHPRALRHYFRAGFDLHPSVGASGAANRSRLPAGLLSRPGDPGADRETIDAASRHVRGAAHGSDVGAWLEAGAGLWVIEGRGFAVEREGSPAVLAAVDDEAAADLLWTCFAAAEPGASIHVDFITVEQQWAMATVLDAGLDLVTEGPVFLRGDVGPFAPYLPSGAYL
jgi:GNAT superfamily N-acetyltransferase